MEIAYFAISFVIDIVSDLIKLITLPFRIFGKKRK